MKKNDILKKAFEEAEKRELAMCIKEQDTIRDFSDEHNQKMQKLFSDNKMMDKASNKGRRKLTFGRIAAVAIIMMFCVLVTVASFDISLLDGGKDSVIDFKVVGSQMITEYEAPELEYTGRNIKVNFIYDAGDETDLYEQGLMIYIDGVRQTFNVKSDNEKIKNTQMYKFIPQKSRKLELNLSFQPNIGKKGEKCDMELVLMNNPDYQVQKESPISEAGIVEEVEVSPYRISVFSLTKVIMKKDAPSQTDVCTNYSKTNTTDKDIDSYAIYNDAEVAFNREKGIRYTGIHTKPNNNDKMTISLPDNGDIYRIALYINGKIMHVFDGCDYADIKTSKDKKTEVEVNFNSTELNEVNSCYIIYKNLSDDFDEYDVRESILHKIYVE